MLFDAFICRKKLDEERENPWRSKRDYRETRFGEE
jgi:hypothetical protein